MLRSVTRLSRSTAEELQLRMEEVTEVLKRTATKGDIERLESKIDSHHAEVMGVLGDLRCEKSGA